jgi:superfamily II DNA helicase RecQ
VVEVSVPLRAQAICSLLAKPERRPAIVYATSRKQSESLAEELSHTLRASAYHAGLDAATRERVQTAFQAGELEVVVATIAFGMGIDKADIRTVIHAGLPGTLEGYYQEIGRAGRDGAPSRTFLMHSYADQRTHDFFLGRDYPPTDHLQEVFRNLSEEPRAVEELRAKSKLAEEEFYKALEKLEIHGGARLSFGSERHVTAGGLGWKKTYAVQAQYRAEQFEKVLRFTKSSECRMAQLVRHFGDVEDASRACGVCDVCNPASAVLKLFRRATREEQRMAQAIADDLRSVNYKAAGTLQRGLDPTGGMSRDKFEGLLDAMTRPGLIAVEDAEYEKDGEVRRFRKISLTEAGLEMRNGSSTELLISEGIVEEFIKTSQVTKRKRQASGSAARTDSGQQKIAKTAEIPSVTLESEDEALVLKLREWRSSEAKRLGVPTFLILHDKTLRAVAQARPSTSNQLLTVSGFGSAKVEKFGEAILELCKGVS